MKTIILFRHSESGWNTNYGGDHELTLTEKGAMIARKMGIIVEYFQYQYLTKMAKK